MKSVSLVKKSLVRKSERGGGSKRAADNEEEEGRATVEVRTNMAVLYVAFFPSMQHRAVGIIGCSRREPGTTHSFDSGDAHACGLPAVREWHSLR